MALAAKYPATERIKHHKPITVQESIMLNKSLSFSRRRLLRLLGTLSIVSIQNLTLSSVQASQVAPSIRTVYRMAQIDGHILDGRTDAEELMARIREQIDIVHSVRLPPRMLDAVLRVPVIVSLNGQSDSYNRGKIWIDPTTLSVSRPILLHEYLHALHDQVLPDGPRNPDIIAFYYKARDNPQFPLDSYMFNNPFEFFAMTASAVLYGTIQREPFTRKNVRTTMPEYYKWLEALFEAKGRWN